MGSGHVVEIDGCLIYLRMVDDKEKSTKCSKQLSYNHSAEVPKNQQIPSLHSSLQGKWVVAVSGS